MFTGIVERTGVVVERREQGASLRLAIDAEGWPPSPTPGESISLNGCCLTLVEADGGRLAFDVVPQTCSRTTLGRWRLGDRVNLERSVTPATLLGGHLVQGHVDGTGEVVALDRGDDWRVRFAAPPEVAPFLVERGSIAVDGVSLTLASVRASSFEVALIPETLARTTLASLKPGDLVNLEADAIAKLVDAAVRRAMGRE